MDVWFPWTTSSFLVTSFLRSPSSECASVSLQCADIIKGLAPALVQWVRASASPETMCQSAGVCGKAVTYEQTKKVGCLKVGHVTGIRHDDKHASTNCHGILLLAGPGVVGAVGSLRLAYGTPV